MHILSILGPALSLAALVTFAKRRCNRPPAKPLPDSAKLGGVPLRHLLDDPCGPGAVLRDMLSGTPRGDGRE